MELLQDMNYYSWQTVKLSSNGLIFSSRITFTELFLDLLERMFSFSFL